jgi:hypothetical protein
VGPDTRIAVNIMFPHAIRCRGVTHMCILTQHADRERERCLAVLYDALCYHPHVILSGDLVVTGSVQNVNRFLSGGVQQHHTGLGVHKLN